MSTFTIEHTQTLTTLDCGVSGCGIAFAIPKSLYRKARADHRVRFYCPNGHRVGYSGESDVERAERERDAARTIAQREREIRQRTEYQRRAAVGQVTKIKRRIGRGVCPCCNRTFADLARHMAGQHPEFVETESAATTGETP